VADVASYFVGKYFSLTATVLREASVNGRTENGQSVRDDLRFCLSIWDLLNLDVALLADNEQVPELPEWLMTILKTGWKDPFYLGANRYEVVLRDAMRMPRPYNVNPRVAFPVSES
jgi:hypothetical protein